jgi:predicted component of type VI protein secretion system
MWTSPVSGKERVSMVRSAVRALILLGVLVHITGCSSSEPAKPTELQQQNFNDEQKASEAGKADIGV